MIRKITVLNQRALSWEHNEYKPVTIMEAASKQLAVEAEFFLKASQLIKFIEQFPNEPLEKMVSIFFPGENRYTIKKTGKNKRSINVHGGLYIHEES